MAEQDAARRWRVVSGVMAAGGLLALGVAFPVWFVVLPVMAGLVALVTVASA